ncbi:hypothetical protein ACX9I7_12055 [Streptomyces sp. L500]
MIENPAPALADALLTAVAPLPFPQRVRHIALWARELGARGELGAALAELSARGTYERRVAAMAATAGRDVTWLRARLTDPDPAVRGHSVTAVRRGLIPDAAVVAALDDAPLTVRREIARAVVAGRRTAVAEALVRPVHERWGDAEAAKLLPACGPATVAELLPALFHTAVPWSRLADRHPDAVLHEAERRLTALSEDHRRRWWQAYGFIVAATIGTRPSKALDLLERLCPGTLPERVHRRLGRLAAADPDATLRLLTAPGREDRELHGLKPRVLRLLVRHRPPGFDAFARVMGRDDRALARLLKTMAPSRRAECYDLAMDGRSTSHSALSHGILDVLPRARRHAEARRMAEQAREHGGSWQLILSAVAHLPVAEARPELLAATRRSEPTERAYAYKLLVRNAALTRDPAAVTELLAGLDRLRNEQQPVRSAFLAALADLRPGLFAGEAAPHLERLTTDTVEARDFSWPESHALRTLARALLREQVGGDDEPTGWALRTLARLRGAVPSREDLRPGQEHEVFAALRPSLEAAADRADFTKTIQLADSLQELGHGIPGLQALLRRAIEHGTPDDGQQAAAHWLDDPRTRDARLTELLALEPSAATLSPVRGTLVRRRTDLLDALLGDTPPYGRFLIEGSHWLPPVCRDTAHWTPPQQAAAARLLARAAADDGLTIHQRVRALWLAAWIPGHGTELLLRFADNSDVPLAEAALAALARTDTPGRHLRLLLSHAGGDRARVAIPAASRASRFVAPSALAGELRRLLTSTSGTKVTSRKEAARLAATALPAPEAVALLAEACALPDQHHDVRAACVAVAKSLLAHEDAWALLETAAAGRSELRKAVLASRPHDLPEHHRPRYAALVRAACDTDDPEVARLGYPALGTWSPWSPDAARLLEAAVTDLENRASWRQAADALCDLVALAPSGSPDAAPLLRTLTALAEADALPGTPDAEPDRDRPARRRVRHLIAALAARSAWQPRAVRAAAPAVAELLGRLGDYGPEAADLLTRTLDPYAAPEALSLQLEHLARCHDGRPALAARTAASLNQRLDTRTGDAALAHAARALTAAGSHAAGLFAVALTAMGGRRTHWSAPWRDQLRALRRHAHPDVRDEALATATAEE